MAKWLKSAERLLENLDQQTGKIMKNELGLGVGDPEDPRPAENHGNILDTPEFEDEDVSRMEIVKIKKQVNELLHSENLLMSELTEKSNILRDSENQVSSLLRQVETLRSEKDREIHNLTRQLRNGENSINQIHLQLRQAESANKNLREEIHEYKMRANALLSAKEVVNITGEGSENDPNDPTPDQKDVRLNEFHLKFEHLETELEDANRRCLFLEDHYTKEVSSLKALLEENRRTVALEKSKTMAIMRENASYRAKIAVLERERAAYEKKLRELESRRDINTRSPASSPVIVYPNEASSNTINQLSTALERRQAEIKSLRQEKVALQIKIERSADSADRINVYDPFVINSYNSILILSKIDAI